MTGIISDCPRHCLGCQVGKETNGTRNGGDRNNYMALTRCPELSGRQYSVAESFRPPCGVPFILSTALLCHSSEKIEALSSRSPPPHSLCSPLWKALTCDADRAGRAGWLGNPISSSGQVCCNLLDCCCGEEARVYFKSRFRAKSPLNKD
jgi:hypothetical protein